MRIQKPVFFFKKLSLVRIIKKIGIPCCATPALNAHFDGDQVQLLQSKSGYKRTEHTLERSSLGKDLSVFEHSK